MALSRWYWSVNDLVVSTWSHLVEEANPGGTLPARRRQQITVAGLDGALAQPDALFDEKVVRLPITLLPYTDEQVVSHPAGWFGHLVGNRADLLAELNGLVDLRWRMPVVGDESDESTDGFVVLQADAVVYDEPVLSTNRRVMWDVLVDFTLPRPFWRELPKVELSASTSHLIYTGGSAPIVDPQFTFGADGTVTDGTVTVEIDGMTGTSVVVRRSSTGEWEVREDGVLNMRLLGALTTGFPRWAPRTNLTVTASTAVAVDFYRAWH